MNFFETIFLFFAFQAFIFAIVFFIKKKGDKTGNVLFGMYITLFAYNMIYNALYWSELLYSTEYLHLIHTNNIPWVLYGPILYLYTKRVVFAYRFKSGVLFFSFKKSIKSLNNLIWLRWLNFSFLGYVLSFSTYFILVYFNLLNRESDYFIGFSMVFFTVLLSYFGFLQPKVFDGLSIDKIIPFRKYRKMGLTKYHATAIKSRLITYMKEDKPYLNHELRLGDLAQKFSLSRHHMSQVINEQFDLSFFDFINQYRVEEAKKMMIKNHNLIINDILYSCGFNNRVSFYKAFKKITNTTPSEYRSLNREKRENL